LLPEETLAVPAEARAFAEAVLRPRAGELNDATESAAIFPRDLVTAIADAGLHGVLFDTDVGGRGLQFPILAAATVAEELAYFTPGVASALYDAADPRRDRGILRHQ
jgi:alkylation response protein AidB-like acyl-CoA dehydrogenase